MTFSSTGKAAHRPALSLPLMGGLPDDEDADIEQAALCEHGDKSEHDDDHDPNFYYGVLVLILSALQLLELGSTYLYAKYVPPSVAVVSGAALFCAASIFYKLLILSNHTTALVSKGRMNVLFTTLLLAHLILSALFFLHLGLTGWLDFAEPIPTFMYAASLCCAASILYKLSSTNNPLELTPEVWINVVFATALLAHAEMAFQLLMLGTIFISLVAGILSCTTVSRRWLLSLTTIN
jgi:hypothetical protein